MAKGLNLRRAMALEFFVRHCLVLYEGTATAVERQWGLGMKEIDELELASPPTKVFNVIGSSALAERFGDLTDLGCFYKTPDGLWWLDLDPKFAKCGVIVPIRDVRQPRFITGLRVYRHTRDQRPFMLRLRAERQNAA